MTSVNLLGLILIGLGFIIITYECQNTKLGYMAIVIAAIGGKWLLS